MQQTYKWTKVIEIIQKQILKCFKMMDIKYLKVGIKGKEYL